MSEQTEIMQQLEADDYYRPVYGYRLFGWGEWVYQDYIVNPAQGTIAYIEGEKTADEWCDFLNGFELFNTVSKS